MKVSLRARERERERERERIFKSSKKNLDLFFPFYGEKESKEDLKKRKKVMVRKRFYR